MRKYVPRNEAENPKRSSLASERPFSLYRVYIFSVYLGRGREPEQFPYPRCMTFILVIKQRMQTPTEEQCGTGAYSVRSVHRMRSVWCVCVCV